MQTKCFKTYVEQRLDKQEIAKIEERAQHKVKILRSNQYEFYFFVEKSCCLRLKSRDQTEFDCFIEFP